jgi:hypothetical protein
MTEAKKTGTKRTKSVQSADLVEMAAVPAAEVEIQAEAKPASPAAAPAMPQVEAGTIFSSVQEQGDAFRQAIREAVAVSAQGALEVNDKIIEALQTQSHAALDLWRTAITTSDLPQVFQTQTSATRQAYEAASAQWKDVAETTARWMTRSFEPLQTALHRQAR